MYKYCTIDMPDHPSLETMVTNIRAKVPAYLKHGGQFDADTQRTNVAGTQVILFTLATEDFPSLVRNALGFVGHTRAGITAMLATSEWTPTEEA